MGTVIKKCKCENDYQDKQYGKNNRLFNTCDKDKKKCRCTICGREENL